MKLFSLFFLLAMANTALATDPPVVPEGKHVIWGLNPVEHYAITYDYKVFRIDKNGEYHYLHDIDRLSNEKFEQDISGLNDEIKKVKTKLKKAKTEKEKSNFQLDLEHAENRLKYTKDDYKVFKKEGDLVDRVFAVMHAMKFKEIKLTTENYDQYIEFRNGDERHAISWVEAEQPQGISDGVYEKMEKLIRLLMQAI